MNTRLLEASNSSQTVAEVKLKVDKINVESSQYKRHVEKMQKDQVWQDPILSRGLHLNKTKAGLGVSPEVQSRQNLESE